MLNYGVNSPGVEPMIALADATESVDRTMKLFRTFPASREAVWQAFTDRDCYVAWMVPNGLKAERCELDVHPGGRYRLFLRTPDGEEQIVSGEFNDVIFNERLAFTWGWEKNGKRGTETNVTVELYDDAKGTKLKLTQSVFETLESRDEHAQGWEGSLGNLEDYLAR
jgi:uncharacterized protein YndB with AHSA1/START domain